MTLKLVIWDMDGTLVDSRASIQNAMADAFVACDLVPPEFDDLRQTIGLGLHDVFRQLTPEDCHAEKLETLVEAYKQAFFKRRQAPDYHEPLYDGARETLERLADENWLQALATGKSHRGIRAVFESHNLGPYFDSIHCADDGPGKPNPFMLHEAMGALGAEPMQCVMIGDAVFDMQMGRAAGMHTLGVSWGFGAAHELTEAGAHDVHHTFKTLNAALDGFGVRA